MTSTFTHRSVVPAAADAVFAWHEQPDALAALLPSAARVEHRSGAFDNGGHVTMSIGVGPLRIWWEARHYGYVPGRQFCDEQVRGPFRTWRHVHRVEPIGDEESAYEDRVEYGLPGGPFVHRAFDPVFRRLLASAFARRHRIVKARFARTRSEPPATPLAKQTS